MAAPAFYFVGGEDVDHVAIAGATVDTTAGHFRSAYARCGLSAPAGSFLGYWRNLNAWSASSFWFSAQIWLAGSSSTSTNEILLYFADASQIVRFKIQATSTPNLFTFFKVNAAGTTTALGSNFSLGAGALNASNKLDIQMVDAVSGSIAVYLNGLLVYSFSGDTTTDGVSTLAYHYLSNPFNAAPQWVWSEIVISDSDTRSMSLQTLAPVANGNTHNFDTGSPAAANVNEITLNDTTLDGSTTAGQIDQYTIPALASGTYSILAIAVSARAQKGSSGPSKADTGVRSGGTDTWSADHALTTAWAAYQDIWGTDPATGAAWAALPANIGLKSVT